MTHVQALPDSALFDLSLSPSPPLRSALAATEWLRLEFTHQALGDVELQPFKGDLWRSVFCMCLKDEDGPAFEALYTRAGAAHGHRVHTWSLQPPLVNETWIPAGALLTSAVTLFGPSMLHAPACVKAMAAFENCGIGYGGQRVAMRLVDVCARRLDERVNFDAAPNCVSALEVFNAALDELHGRPPCGIELRLLTPMELIQNNVQVNAAPPFALLLRRVVGQIVAAAPHGLPDGLFASGEKYAWMEWADGVQTAFSATDDAGPGTGSSSRQDRSYSIQGQAGAVLYRSPASLALPWLRLAEWLQVGKKVHYGCGVVAARLRPEV
jgi:hypothetical protein